MKVKAKPFIKWVGGKGQLIEQLGTLLPKNFSNRQDVTYIEPFVGGGAMLFHMLQTYTNIKRAIVNDINHDLTTCYQVVKERPAELIDKLQRMQDIYYSLHNEEQKRAFYLSQRELFNTKKLTPIENTVLFFFLNRTCFNGLYRVNKSGLFNVPFGRYETPTICDEDTIYADSQLLQRVTILTGDYQQTLKYADKRTFFYFDPPYRPLSNTSNFKDYTKENFNDAEQIRLKQFCDTLDSIGTEFMLSNSDCFAKGNDPFFDELYTNYNIVRVLASRNVSAKANSRGKLTELLIRNY